MKKLAIILIISKGSDIRILMCPDMFIIHAGVKSGLYKKGAVCCMTRKINLSIHIIYILTVLTDVYAS